MLRDFAQVRALQNQILEDYTRDFAKHMPMRLLPKALDAWHSVPAHLSHENKKFVFGRIREGARAKDFEDALIWLQQAGLISKVPRVKNLRFRCLRMTTTRRSRCSCSTSGCLAP